MTMSVLDADNCCFILVDAQERLVPLMHMSEEVVARMRLLCEGIRLLEIPYFICEQYPKGLGPTIPELAEFKNEYNTYEKTSFSLVGARHLVEHLENGGHKQVILSGVEAHVCVLQSAIQLKDMGYDVHVPFDTTSSRRVDHRDNALGRMASCGIQVSSVESVLFEILKDSRHDSFKEISRLIR